MYIQTRDIKHLSFINCLPILTITKSSETFSIYVTAITERFVIGLAASAEAVIILQWIFLPLTPLNSFTICVDTNNLFA